MKASKMAYHGMDSPFLPSFLSRTPLAPLYTQIRILLLRSCIAQQEAVNLMKYIVLLECKLCFKKCYLHIRVLPQHM